MSVSENSYKVSQGTSEKTIPLIYGKEDVLIEELYNAQKFREYTVDVTRYYSGAGKTMQIPVENFHWGVNELTETVSTPISELGWTSKDMTFKWYGDAKQFTIESDAVVSSYTLGDFRGKALKAMGENRDLVIMDEWSNTTEDAVYPMNSSGTARETSSTVSEEFKPEQVLVAQTKMMEDKLSLSRVIIHPRQRASLLNNSNWLDFSKSNRDTFVSGILYDNFGVEYVTHNAVQSTTENSKTVYIAYAIVDKPTFYAQKQAPVYELDRRDILDRAITFHYYEAFGVKNIRDKGIIPVKSVGHTL